MPKSRPRARASQPATPRTRRAPAPDNAGKFWSQFTPDARISAATVKRAKASPIFVRPAGDPAAPGHGLPIGPGGVDPCGGLQLVRAPAIGVQLNLSVNSQPCPPQSTIDQMLQGIRGAFGPVLPNADIRVKCANGLLTIGVWPPIVAGDNCDEQARERGFDRIDLIDPSFGNLGLFINSAFISQQAAKAFAAAPKQLATNGAPSASGPIHLTGISVTFQAPDTVNTLVTGFDDRPWPDVDFTLTMTDRLQANLQAVSTSDVATDDSWKAVLGAILLGGASYFLPLLLPVTLFVLANDLDAAVGQSGGSGGGNASSGAGARALALVPVDVPLKGGSKLAATYGRAPVVNGGGIYFNGAAFPATRTPSISITGPASLTLPANLASVSGAFAIHAIDTFGTLTIAWSGGTGVTVASPSAAQTRATFARGKHTAGTSFTASVRVTVSDQDGFSKSAAMSVTITVTDADDLPVVCRTKPWLPQCQV